MQSFRHKYGSVREIPPFKGLVSLNMYSIVKKSNTGSPTATSSSTTQSMPKRTSSQPIEIPEIPPFKKRDNQHSNYPPSPYETPTSQSPQNTFTMSTSASPPRISDIPPYKPRKSKEFTGSELNAQQSSSPSSHHRESYDSAASSAKLVAEIPEHQITIGPTGGAEWARRLKVAEQSSPIHRSTDCIVSKQELGTSSDSELLKPAPSWSNVALKTDQAGTSGSTSLPSVPKATTAEDEQRAAEIAAKKSRLKQKLVKSARSVAIFSLKLKERRAREAERLAKEKAEELATEMAMSAQAMCGGGGELNLIPLEQLIHIEDVVNRRSSNTQNSSSNNNTNNNYSNSSNNNGSGT
ncbi:unnamed protein product [Chironomus riparius]|uniref:Uncharacterized protein n=1 Tax=Chironomus riparius TaxID=315576 RepID=A0A9N9RLQ6_9DIPT|nr:unnamed protein product [Chironomus riparius]